MSELTQQMAVSKRVTIVDTLGTGSDGESLAGQNVNNYPEGAMFYVKSFNRLYRLRKNLNPLIVEDVSIYKNVVVGVSSSSVNGFFVAADQFAEVTLSGSGTGVAIGWCLSPGGLFACSYVTPGGTQGFLHAVATGGTSLVSVTVTSSSASDTSAVLVKFTQLQ